MNEAIIKENAKKMVASDLWKSYLSLVQSSSAAKINYAPTFFTSINDEKVLLEFVLSDDNKEVIVFKKFNNGAHRELKSYKLTDLVKTETTKKAVKTTKTTKSTTTKKQPAKKEKKAETKKKTTTKKK